MGAIGRIWPLPESPGRSVKEEAEGHSVQKEAEEHSRQAQKVLEEVSATIQRTQELEQEAEKTDSSVALQSMKKLKLNSNKTLRWTVSRI